MNSLMQITAYTLRWSLSDGVAKEVARNVLPVGIYTKFFLTVNPRSIMAFLSLRTKSDDATFKSFPQWEINKAADMLEDVFKELWPVTHAAFVENGRVCP